MMLIVEDVINNLDVDRRSRKEEKGAFTQLEVSASIYIYITIY